MALLKIAEPGGKPVQQPRRRAVGIDLGTTNSLVATRCGIKVETLPDEQGRHLLPSIVHYRAGQQPAVGYQAVASRISDPVNTIVSVKRLLGRSLGEIRRQYPHLACQFVDNEPEAMPVLVTAAGHRNPMEVSADILRVLVKRAEKYLAGPLDGAVITVPAYFNDAQRQQTRDAARLAGLKVLRLLNEPTAAAVAYGLDSRDQGNVVVFDLGGGTFDVSLLSLQQGVFQVLATGGDTSLGGDDFDLCVSRWIQQQAGAAANLDATERGSLLALANQVRHQLTESDSVQVQWRHWQGTLTNTLLAELCVELLERTIKTCRRVLRDAGMDVTQVNNIVLVGGATRMPIVRNQVEKFFGKSPLASIDPDKVVAIGAGIQADILAGNKSPDHFLLLDVNPLSLGLETMGELVEKIIPRNTTIPTSRAQEFTTFKDGQTAMIFHVVQGERERVIDCRSLARFELRGIPPMVAGAAKVRVTFQVDADGLLNVSASELSTGKTAEVQVKPSYGLAADDIERMLLASQQHAAEDMQLRAVTEARLEARQLLDALQSAMAADGELLTHAERDAIASLSTQLEAAIGSDDIRFIHQLTEKLNHASEDFASRRMDHKVAEALRGESIDAMQD